MSEIVSNHIIVIVRIIIIIVSIIIFLLNRSKPRQTKVPITLGIINNQAIYYINAKGGINKSLKKKYKKLKNIITPFSLNNRTF